MLYSDIPTHIMDGKIDPYEHSYCEYAYDCKGSAIIGQRKNDRKGNGKNDIHHRAADFQR